MPGKAKSLDDLDESTLTTIKESNARKETVTDDLDEETLTALKESHARKDTVIGES